MKGKQWSFLTNYGVVFTYIAKNPKSTIQNIAQMTNLSIRYVNIIIDNLIEAGYITKVKEGRCNYYIVHPEQPVKEDLIGECTIGDVLKVFGCVINKTGGLKAACTS
jgi:predicted transcriptional regulator